MVFVVLYILRIKNTGRLQSEMVFVLLFTIQDQDDMTLLCIVYFIIAVSCYKYPYSLPPIFMGALWYYACGAAQFVSLPYFYTISSIWWEIG